MTQCTVIKHNGDNTVLTGAVDTNVKMWDLRMKQCINTYKSHTKEITCLDISPDAKMCVSGSTDGTLKFWDLHS